MKKLLFIFLSLSINSYAVEPMDNYYADDLLDAVSQAKEKPHHYDYSSTYRYKRTTAQSIEMNRLDLNELDETRLDMQGQVSTHIPDAKDEEIVSLKNNIDLPDNRQNPSITIENILPVNSHYESNYGSYQSTGAISQGTVISTPRP